VLVSEVEVGAAAIRSHIDGAGRMVDSHGGALVARGRGRVGRWLGRRTGFGRALFDAKQEIPHGPAASRHIAIDIDIASFAVDGGLVDMSARDYRSYLNVVNGLNAQACEELAGHKAGLEAQARKAAFEARLADAMRWREYADEMDRRGPSLLGDALRNPKFSPQIFVRAVVDGVQCVQGAVIGAQAGGAVGGTAGAAVGSVAGPAGAGVGAAVGGVVGATAGGLGGCAAGIANAEVGGPPIG